jgi:hypothetical protein
MTVEFTTQAICDLALRFGEGEAESMANICCYYYQNTILPMEFLMSTYLLLQSRPFGVPLLITGDDENGPSL